VITPHVVSPEHRRLFQAKNNMTIARISVELGSRGTMHAVTMAAISVDEFIGSLK